jgi:hypothetical protein
MVLDTSMLARGGSRYGFVRPRRETGCGRRARVGRAASASVIDSRENARIEAAITAILRDSTSRVREGQTTGSPEGLNPSKAG